MPETRREIPTPESEPRKEAERLDSAPEVRWLREHHPVFSRVRFETVDDPSFEGGSFALPEGDDDEPTVLLAAGGTERFARLKETRKEAIEAMAREIGRPFESLTGEDIRDFIMFHEAGHARDFLENFHGPDSGVDSADAVAAWRANSGAQVESLPFPGASPAVLREEIEEAGGFAAWRGGNPENDKWCRERGVTTERELLRIQEEAYRALDKERYADRFAARVFAERRGARPAEAEDLDAKRREVERKLEDIQLRFADLLWRKSPETDRPSFSDVVRKETAMGYRLSSRNQEAREALRREVETLHGAGGEGWREKVIALLDAAAAASGRAEGAPRREYIGIFDVNLRTTNALEPYGITGDDELLQLHVQEAFMRPDVSIGPESIRKTMAELAEAIVDEYPFAKAVYGDSWLMGHPLAKRLGFTIPEGIKTSQNAPNVWNQFITAEGKIDEKKVKTLFETGKPPIEARIGYMPVEELLRRYLPKERRGKVVLQEATKESARVENDFFDQMGTFRQNWGELTEENVERVLESLPDVAAALEASGRRDAFVALVKEGLREGKSLDEVNTSPLTKELGAAIRAAHRKRMETLRHKKEIIIE